MATWRSVIMSLLSKRIETVRLRDAAHDRCGKGHVCMEGYRQPLFGERRMPCIVASADMLSVSTKHIAVVHAVFLQWKRARLQTVENGADPEKRTIEAGVSACRPADTFRGWTDVCFLAKTYFSFKEPTAFPVLIALEQVASLSNEIHPSYGGTLCLVSKDRETAAASQLFIRSLRDRRE